MSAQRAKSFEKLAENGVFDAVVIGGGINGLGVFRDLSLQGLRVLLVERNDFCSGCSAAPSRMIHGGLRYLENGEFDLVRESLAERDALLANAPHMVRPLPTTIPITSYVSGLFNSAASLFGGSGKPSSRGALPIKLGLTLYDMITRGRSRLPKHTFRGAEKTRQNWPELTGRLCCSATYYDAWISYPERLGVELVLDTESAAPASIALNYAEISPQREGYTVTDRETGNSYAISTRVIVNASGAWLDEVNAQIAPRGEGSGPLVSGTKGSHLIIDNDRLLSALNGHMIYFENTDGRVCIVFPYLGKVLAGSTDIRVQHAGRTRCEDEELEYILGSLKLVFPEIAIHKSDVVFSYSGIRPLPVSDHDFTGRISRDHKVHRMGGPVPQFCMVGGKWTSFRAFSEQTANAVLRELGRERVTSTEALPIGGGRDYPEKPELLVGELMETFGISQARAIHMADAYGTRAQALLTALTARPDDAPIAGLELTASEIALITADEHVEHLSDIILRRTSLAITGRIDQDQIEAIAAVMAQALGWDDARRARECQAVIEELRDYHGVPPEILKQRAETRSRQCA